MDTSVINATSPYKMDATFKLRAEPASVRTARELTDVVLMSWALRYLVDPAKLIVSELFTNAARAAPGEDLYLLLDNEVRTVRLGVWDSSPAMPVIEGHDLEDESGRGLHIVAALADGHGVAPVSNPRGKVVWARLTI
ncbi:ATP-binding protein [Actinomadura alba]|uniref:ATP-binding protein n=1 Tax=Actinomadura alba TaxID=406431 RepID=A0ABR7LQT6_9ACTN|nr:ATP-binding protein [Actinomadura alba]MBC6467213.1 ATP-binding protein [Actinomadura alba]